MRRIGSFGAYVSSILVVALLVMGGGGSTAAAQDEATPGPGELNITVDADGYHVLETVAAGWYIVTLENTTEEDVVADLVLLPAGKKVDEFQKSLSTESGGSTIPDWFEQVVFAGGPSAPAKSTAQTLVELTPGTWSVLEIGQTDGKSAEVDVTESDGPSTPPTMTANVDVTMGPTKMEMPAQLTTGYQVWNVTNTDTLTHSFALIKLPAAVSYEQLLTLLTTGTAPEGVDMSQSVVVGGIGLLSCGRTIWTGFNLEPGSYAALDYVPTKDGRTYSELGQFAVFTVQ
jgi:hypothetical protein